MASDDANAGDIRLIGGILCLDFVNTVDWRTSQSPDERLREYGDLAVWGKHVGILSDDQMHQLIEEGQRMEKTARQAVDDAIFFRETLFQLLAATIQKQDVSPDHLAHFNAELKQAATHLELERLDSGYEWDFPMDLDCIVWPVVWSAATLLTSELLDSVKICEGPGCGWMFLDTSPNQRRRWCSMESCGNRAKARRHYKKSKSEDA